MTPFCPTENLKTLQALKAATITNAERDKVDHLHREALSLQIRTAITAIITGYELQSWTEVMEGVSILMQAEVPLRELESRIQIVLKDPPKGKRRK